MGMKEHTEHPADESANHPDPVDLAEYLAGKREGPASAEVDAWAGLSVANKTILTALEHTWNDRSSSRVLPEDSVEALARLRTRLQLDKKISEREEADIRAFSADLAPSSDNTIRGVRSGQHSRWKLYAPLAAVVLFIAVAITSLNTGGNGSSDGDIFRASYVSQVGETPVIDLPDGSTVTLNAASRIEVLNDGSSRSIVLQGEALFNVVPDTKRPFVVKTHDIHTTVLGTEFGIRAYDDDEIRVAVRSGKVRVEACKEISGKGAGRSICSDAGDRFSPDETGVTLSANQIVIAGTQYPLTVGVGTPVDKALAFADGQLMLNEIPLAKAIADLNRWYGVEIQITDPQLGKALLKGSLPHGTIDDLEQALNVILNANISRSGRVITISRGTL